MESNLNEFFSRVRSGIEDGGTQLPKDVPPEEAVARIKAEWLKILGPEGFKTYPDVEERLGRTLGSNLQEELFKATSGYEFSDMLMNPIPVETIMAMLENRVFFLIREKGLTDEEAVAQVERELQEAIRNTR